MDLDLGALGFWIFVCVFWVCETYMYTHGHDTFLFTHKTEAEQSIRDKQAKGNHEDS